MLNIIVLCITVLNGLLFNATSECFICIVGIRQGECISSFLFTKYAIDLEEHVLKTGGGCVGTAMLVFLLFYAYDTVLLADNEMDNQTSLNVLHSCV